MRRSFLPIALLLLGLLGCPPPRPPEPTAPLPTAETTEHPGPPKPTTPAADDKPAEPRLSDADMAALISSMASTGVITALPHIKVFLKEKRIEVEGITAMKVGPQLELLACSLRGKAYESLLVWQCEPRDLQLALLMIGLQPTPQIEQFGQPGALEKGEKVRLDVEWTDPVTKQPVKRRAEDLLFDIYRDGG